MMSSRDRITISGSLLGLLSLFAVWLTVKPNRIAAGSGLNIIDSGGWLITVTLVLLWLACLALGIWGRGKKSAVALGILAGFILIMTFLDIGLSADTLVSGAGSLARVSMGPGPWLTLAAVYIVLFASRRRLEKQRLLSNIITWAGVAGIAVLFAAGWLDNLSFVREFAGQEARFRQELLQHVFLFAGSVAAGVLLGVPLGIWASRSPRAERPVFFITGIMQTVPSLALFGFLIAPLSALSFAVPALRELGIRGVGVTPAVIALVIYSLLPIVRNTYVSLRRIDHAVLDAGRGMGMKKSQIFLNLEVPLSAPLVMEGVRTASVQAVGNTTVAALIGAGGLGWFVFQGLGQAAPDLIILGAIPVIVMALAVDIVMRIAVRLVTPRGLAEAAR